MPFPTSCAVAICTKSCPLLQPWRLKSLYPSIPTRNPGNRLGPSRGRTGTPQDEGFKRQYRSMVGGTPRVAREPGGLSALLQNCGYPGVACGCPASLQVSWNEQIFWRDLWYIIQAGQRQKRWWPVPTVVQPTPSFFPCSASNC